MSTRYLTIPPCFLNRRINRVGILGRQLFVHPNSENSIEIWSVDSIFPDSWKCLFNLPASLVIYSIPAFSYDLPYILVFFGGALGNWSDFEILIYRLNYETGEVKKFRLDPSLCIPPNSFDLPLETLSLRIGAKMQCCLFDRSIVQGPIPFWRLNFDEQKEMFWYERDDIREARDSENVRDADTRLHCSRFSIAFDAPNRIFGRLQDDGSMMIYNPTLQKWLQYSLSNFDDSNFDLPPTTVRGIRETYGRNGRRIGAVESNLTFHPESNGICVVKLVKLDNRHCFYQMRLDHSSQTFSFSPRGSVYLENGVEKMFYTLCSEDIFVFLGIRTIAIVSLQPFRLQDSAIWRLQKFSAVDLREEEIKELCKIVYRNLS